MKVELRIDPELAEPRVVVYAPADDGEAAELVRRLERAAGLTSVTGFREGKAHLLAPGAILRFFTDGKGVSCQTVDGEYVVRQRLYELEEMLEGTRFVRVSHSEIVNLDQVTALDLSLTGTIKMTLKGNTVVYVSRRYVKKIKQAVGL